MPKLQNYNLFEKQIMANSDKKKSAKIIETKPANASKKKVKKSTKEKSKTSKKDKDILKQYEPADLILALTQELEPPQQGILHRFSMHLQARIAREAVKWTSIYALIMTLIAGGLAIYSSSSVKIIAVDSNGMLYSIANERMIGKQYSNSQVINFANEVMTEAFDINFVNFEKRLEYITNKYFTQSSKMAFMVAMQPILKELSSSQGMLIIQSANNKSPQVLRGNPDGDEWVVRLPVVMTLTTNKGSSLTNQRNLTVTVKKANDVSNLKGLVVTQVVQADI